MAELLVGVIADPQSSEYWPQIETFLRSAAQRGGLETLVDEHELVWGVLDGAELLAAATIRLTDDGVAEITRCGGVEHRKWAGPAMQAVCDAARRAGARSIRMYGRNGWVRVHGLDTIRDAQGRVAHERVL